MKRIPLFATAMFAIAAMVVLSVWTPTIDFSRGRTRFVPGPEAPLFMNGKLSVCGLQLCNRDHVPVQLRGMSSHGLQWHVGCVSEDALDVLAGEWGADVLRVSTYIQEGGYASNPAKFTDYLHNLINSAEARGMYVIVDWHVLDPGDPMFNMDLAKTFFAQIAERHRDAPHVLYEVANEPNGVPWATVKRYHEEIIPVIRRFSPDSVILLGTPFFSSFGEGNDDEIVNSPVSASNVMYTFHFYASSHGLQHLRYLEDAAERLPIFVSEFGSQEDTGDGPDDFVMADRYLDFLKAKKVSWVNWNYSDDPRSGAVFKPGACEEGDFAGTGNLKPAGLWVRERIRKG